MIHQRGGGGGLLCNRSAHQTKQANVCCLCHATGQTDPENDTFKNGVTLLWGHSDYMVFSFSFFLLGDVFSEYDN